MQPKRMKTVNNFLVPPSACMLVCKPAHYFVSFNTESESTWGFCKLRIRKTKWKLSLADILECEKGIHNWSW